MTSFLSLRDTGWGQGGTLFPGTLTVLVHSSRPNPLALLLLANWVTDRKGA